jgi:hypothetical protein
MMEGTKGDAARTSGPLGVGLNLLTAERVDLVTGQYASFVVTPSAFTYRGVECRLF